MKPKVYVDGQEGTTGLRIHELLAARPDVELLRIDNDKRKDAGERKRLINAADLVFLCLPDAASREAVALVENPATRMIDASTAFRTDAAWVYGLPELNSGQRDKLRQAKRIANPGCHATAFILAIAPLVAAGIVKRDAVLTSFSITGYSGGGKKMIAAYEAADAPAKYKNPRHYALKMGHKHLPEMQVQSGLTAPPLFTPVVCNTYAGLAAEVFLPPVTLARAVEPGEVHAALVQRYTGEKFVRVMPWDPEATLDEGALDMTACNGTNRAEIFVFGQAGRIAVITRLDNLGKGASGAAVQCMNLALGFEEAAGLEV